MIKRNKRGLLTEIIFWTHLPITIIWIGLFLIPLSVWPGRITFHFGYIFSIVLIQIIWGEMLYSKTKKIRIICPITTLMQSLRGYPIESKKNYDHSFVAEFFNRLRFKLGPRIVGILIWITLIIALIQYIWFR
jgi:hypothetical protein